MCDPRTTPFATWIGCSRTSPIFSSDFGTLGKRQIVTNALCGIVHRLPCLRSHFPLTRKALTGWSRLTPPCAGDFLTPQLLQGIVGNLLASNQPSTALCLLLSWAGLVLAPEALYLQVRDIAFAPDPRFPHTLAHSVAVLIRESKTGPLQAVLITYRPAVVWLVLVVANLRESPHSWIFPFAYGAYCTHLRNAAFELGIGGLRITT